MRWVECIDCSGVGWAPHECGEDTCCCADPQDNVCNSCGGRGGWDEHEEGNPDYGDDR